MRGIGNRIHDAASAGAGHWSKVRTSIIRIKAHLLGHVLGLAIHATLGFRGGTLLKSPLTPPWMDLPWTGSLG